MLFGHRSFTASFEVESYFLPRSKGQQEVSRKSSSILGFHQRPPGRKGRTSYSHKILGLGFGRDCMYTVSHNFATLVEIGCDACQWLPMVVINAKVRGRSVAGATKNYGCFRRRATLRGNSCCALCLHGPRHATPLKSPS